MGIDIVTTTSFGSVLELRDEHVTSEVDIEMVDNCDVGVGRWFVGGRTKSLEVKTELKNVLKHILL